MNHGTILLCESLGTAPTGRAELKGLIFVAKASPKFRFEIYGSYFIDLPKTNDVEVRVTDSLDTKRTLKFMQRRVSAEDMAHRGFDQFVLSDIVLSTKKGRYWFDLIVNGEIVSSTCLTVIP